MRITCFEEDTWSMGYIYLMPPTHESDRSDLVSDIFDHVSNDKLNIPHITSPTEDPSLKLDRMKVAKHTYYEEAGESYETEYGNDMDENGYIIGIELEMQPSRLIELVNNQAFSVIDTRWKGKDFHLLTLDMPEKVFDEKNVLYRMSDIEDAFVIAALPQRTFTVIDPSGHSRTQQDTIIEFRGLLSAREDLYPLKFLLKPDFFLKLNVPKQEDEES